MLSTIGDGLSILIHEFYAGRCRLNPSLCKGLPIWEIFSELTRFYKSLTYPSLQLLSLKLSCSNLSLEFAHQVVYLRSGSRIPRFFRITLH